MKKRCPLKSSVTRDLRDVYRWDYQKVSCGRLDVFKFKVSFFCRASFVYEDVHIAGGVCHPGYTPLFTLCVKICKSASHTPLKYASLHYLYNLKPDLTG